MIIETRDLVIRPFAKSDAETLYRATRCPRVSDMYSGGFVKREDALRYIELLESEYAAGKFRTSAIEEKAGGRLVGSVIADINGMLSRAELSYWIDIDFRNRGYATQAVRAATNYCFGTLSVNRAQAETSCEESEWVLRKCGFRREGTLREYVSISGKARDLTMYAKLRDDSDEIIFRSDMKDLPSGQLMRLFRLAGWSKGDETEEMRARFNAPFINSTLVVSAWRGDLLVGAARVISDKIVRSVVYDLVVDPEARNMGIGKRLLGMCLESYPKSEWLIGTEKGIVGYYEKLGFKTADDDVFVKRQSAYF